MILRALSSLSPELLQIVRVARGRRHIARFERSVGLPQLQRKYLFEFGRVVYSGPFQGLAYIERSCGSSLLPKLLGTYEKELHDLLERAIARNPNLIIDIGSAEGYYAIGMAKRLPTATVLAFDIDPEAQKACRQLAVANNVADRVSVEGKCDPKKLLGKVIPRTLLICDCEGCEYTMFDEISKSTLDAFDLVVELHKKNGINPDTWFTSLLAKSHNVTIVHAQERTVSDFENAAPTDWDEKEYLLAVNEFRNDGFVWGYAESRLW
jgi:hypothetical protein